MKNSRPDLSIVVVTYNNAATIRDCLNSLSEAAAGLATELYIIDNNSQDATTKILKDGQIWKHLSFGHVEKLYNEANVGYTKGVNQGLRRCRGRHVLMLNPDIVFPVNPFPMLFGVLQQDGIGVVSPQFRYPGGGIQPSCRRFPAKRDIFFELTGLSRLLPESPFFNSWRFPDFDHRHSADVSQPQGAFLLTRDETLKDVGLLDESLPMFFSDVDWCRRVHAADLRIRFCADTWVIHHQGASVRQKRMEMIVSSHRSFVAYFKKYDRSMFDKITTAIIETALLIITPLRLLLTKM